MIDFQRMRTLIERIDRAKVNKERMWARTTSVTSVLSDMPKGGQKEGRFQLNMENLIAAENTLKRLQAQLKEQKDLLESVLPQLDPVDSGLLKERYINEKSITRILCETTYSRSHLYRMIECAELRANIKMRLMGQDQRL